MAELLAEEKSNPEIAARLSLARGTVRKYIESLLLITDADSRAGVVMALTTMPADGPVRLRLKEELA